MPYFSFIINNNFSTQNIKEFGHFKIFIKYYSKDTKLWSNLNKLSKKDKDIFLKKEKRTKYMPNKKSILFCLPPNIGLGDAIEYGLAIKSIILHKPDLDIGIAHIGKFADIFLNIFKITKIYDFVTEDELKSFQTIFHFTFEIEELVFQKYNRQNIEKIITKFFHVPLFRDSIVSIDKEVKKRVISIFPVSNSPIRSLPLSIINGIVKNFINSFDIEIYLFSESIISKYIQQNVLYADKILFRDPINLNNLINDIKKIEFGVFTDSGPLHLAKILKKKGILIVSSVSEKILLDNFSNIRAIQSNYMSNYCKGPCGLVNVFKFNNESGCYDSLRVKKNLIMRLDDFKSLQRGNLKESYLNLYINSVNCYKHFNINEINLFLENNLKENYI